MNQACNSNWASYKCTLVTNIIKQIKNTLLDKNEEILNMYAGRNTDQITISSTFSFGSAESDRKPQSVNTCKRPEELPPSSAFLVGWNAVTGSTVLTFSSSVNVCCSQPFSWNTCNLRGLNMLPATKQSSCFGSHTADILLSQRPVCMLCLITQQCAQSSFTAVEKTEQLSGWKRWATCLMDVSRGGLALPSDVSKILLENKYMEPWLKSTDCSNEVCGALSSPDAVVEARSEYSVSCAWGEICAGYTQTMSL